MNRIVYIYTLSHPVTGEVGYVGKTVKKLYARLSAHVSNCQNSKTHVGRWINKLVSIGLYPKIEVVELSNERDWSDSEKYWIEQFRQWGFSLTNICSGGKGTSGYKRIPAIQKPCIQYDLIGNEISRYKSMTEAARMLGMDEGSISECCSKRLNTYRGYIFRKESDPITKDDLIDTIKKSQNKKTTPVYSIDMNGNKTYYVSAKEASDATGADSSHILKCCKQNHRTSKGYKFIFA